MMEKMKLKIENEKKSHEICNLFAFRTAFNGRDVARAGISIQSRKANKVENV